MKITLCGSTRFKEAFEDWNAILTQNGHLVYSCGFYARSDGPNATLTEEQKRHLDLVHLEKISASDAILVLNVQLSPELCIPGTDTDLVHSDFGYFGDSTRREIEWAALQNKLLFALNRDSGLPFSQFMSVDEICSAFDGEALVPPFASSYFGE